MKRSTPSEIRQKRNHAPGRMFVRLAMLAMAALFVLAIMPVMIPHRHVSAFASFVSTSTSAQETAPEQPETKQEDQEEDEEDDEGPSLDDLLGLEEESDEAGGEDAGLPDVREELNPGNQPQAPPIAQLFLDAMDAMDRSMVRLVNDRDPGLVTQRHQEEALLKLSMLIQQAQQQQQQQQGGQQQQQQQEQPENPGDQQQQASSQPGDQPANQDSRPPGREAQLDGEISESRLEWGSLPARIRELLMQGRDESPASLYRLMTERYYRRLAEDAEEGQQP